MATRPRKGAARLRLRFLDSSATCLPFVAIRMEAEGRPEKTLLLDPLCRPWVSAIATLPSAVALRVELHNTVCTRLMYEKYTVNHKQADGTC